MYESDDHIGGRIQSITSAWQNGQVSEWCGEFIDSGHTTIIDLAQRFGLVLDDLLAAEPKNSSETYFFNEKYYSKNQADKDFQVILNILIDQNNSASYPTQTTQPVAISGSNGSFAFSTLTLGASNGVSFC